MSAHGYRVGSPHPRAAAAKRLHAALITAAVHRAIADTARRVRIETYQDTVRVQPSTAMRRVRATIQQRERRQA